MPLLPRVNSLLKSWSRGSIAKWMSRIGRMPSASEIVVYPALCSLAFWFPPHHADYNATSGGRLATCGFSTSGHFDWRSASWYA